MKYSLGAIVSLKDTDKLVMIVGFNGKSSKVKDHDFEYVGVSYPDGVNTNNQACYFDGVHIDSVLFNGYNLNNENTSSQTKYKFDKNGIVVGVEGEDNETSVSSGNYMFDSNGVIIGMKNVDDKVAAPASNNKYKFDVNGVVVGVEGQETANNQYQFDNRGIVVGVN